MLYKRFSKLEIFLMVSSLIVLLYIYYCKTFEVINRFGYQWEVREGAVFTLAKSFADGINPYSISDSIPNPVYMYGIVLPIIVRIMMPLGIKVCIVICEILTLITEISGIVIFGLVELKKKVWLPLIPVGMFFFSCCFYRTSAFSGVFPDTYGLTLSVIVWLIIELSEEKDSFHPIIISTLCVILFFIKLYFACLSVGILVYYFLRKEINKALIVCKYGVLEGITSMVIIRVIFPSYYTYNIFYLGKFTTFSIDNSTNQITEIINVFWFSFFSIFMAILWMGIKKVKKDGKYTYSICQAVILFMIACFMGMNTGAFLQYFFQLFLPYLIGLTIFVWSDCHTLIQQKTAGNIYLRKPLDILYTSVLLLVVVTSVWQYVYIEPLSSYEKEQWSDVYAFMDDYKDKRIKVYSLPLNFYCLDNGIYNDNPGHSNCYKEERLEILSNDTPNSILFPYVEDSTRQYVRYIKESFEKCNEGYYDCILVDVYNDYPSEFELALRDNYELYNIYELVCGIEKWSVKAYIRKESAL